MKMRENDSHETYPIQQAVHVAGDSHICLDVHKLIVTSVRLAPGHHFSIC